MNKKVCILGLGYIGLPTAGILSKNGYNVYGVDLIKSKVDAINSGECYISEPKLKELIFDAVKNKKLKAGTKPIESDIFIIAVPTPFHN